MVQFARAAPAPRCGAATARQRVQRAQAPAMTSERQTRLAFRRPWTKPRFAALDQQRRCLRRLARAIPPALTGLPSATARAPGRMPAHAARADVYCQQAARVRLSALLRREGPTAEPGDALGGGVLAAACFPPASAAKHRAVAPLRRLRGAPVPGAVPTSPTIRSRAFDCRRTWGSSPGCAGALGEIQLHGGHQRALGVSDSRRLGERLVESSPHAQARVRLAGGHDLVLDAQRDVHQDRTTALVARGRLSLRVDASPPRPRSERRPAGITRVRASVWKGT
jgi:hypothetical protein